jgi:uncharacterized OsmC-like protein
MSAQGQAAETYKQGGAVHATYQPFSLLVAALAHCCAAALAAALKLQYCSTAR